MAACRLVRIAALPLHSERSSSKQETQGEGKVLAPRVARKEHVMTEPIIKQQEADLNQVLERVKDLLRYGRLKAARELWVWGTISRQLCIWHKSSSMKVCL